MSSCISHQLLCVGSHYVDISLLKSFGLKEKNTWDLKVIVKKGLKKLTETVLSLTISCLTTLQNVTENTPEITEICVKHFPFFLKTEYKFLFNSSTKYDVSETTTDLPKLKIACHGKPYIRPAAVNMRHDASHRLPGTDDQDKI